MFFYSNKVGYCCKFNPDEDKQHLFVTGMADKKILCWDTRSGEIVQVSANYKLFLIRLTHYFFLIYKNFDNRLSFFKNCYSSHRKCINKSDKFGLIEEVLRNFHKK